MTGPNFVHPDPELVYACPGCDRAGQLRRREDGTIRCYQCDGEFSQDEAVERDNRRGENLTPELRRRGAANGPDYGPERMAQIGRISGRRTEYPVSEERGQRDR